MFRALGLAVMLIVLNIFMPAVLHSGEQFLQTLFDTGTMILQNMQAPLQEHKQQPSTGTVGFFI